MKINITFPSRLVYSNYIYFHHGNDLYYGPFGSDLFCYRREYVVDLKTFFYFDGRDFIGAV